MSVPTTVKSSPNASGSVNKPTTTTTATAAAKVQNPTKPVKFSVNPLWSTIGTTAQLAFAFFCIYLAPFGRSSASSFSFSTQLYDLLFTENLNNYAKVQRGAS